MGDGDDKGLIEGEAARQAAVAAAAEAAKNAVKPEDARRFVENFVHDPAALAKMPDVDLLGYHGKVRTQVDKLVSDAVAKAQGKLEKRPEFVPEQFWDDKAKQINFDATFKSLSDTRQELKKLKGEPPKGIPKDESGYEFTPPADLPDNVESGADDPSMKLIRKISFAVGMTQDQYAKFAEAYLRGAAALLPPAIDPAAEKKALGPNADKVTETVFGFYGNFVRDGTWSQDEFETIVTEGGATAVGMRALNKMRERMGGQQIPVNPGADGQALPSRADLNARVADPRYRSDPAYREQTSQLFREVYGTEQAPQGRAA